MRRLWFQLHSKATPGRVFGLLVLALIIREYVWMPTLITGNSMLPTLRSGQLASVNKMAYWFRRPRRGDVVAIWTGTELMIKRVVGLPGEEVAVQDGTFWIDGKALPEPYVQFCDPCVIAAGKVEPGHFVFAGDNRLGSLIGVVARRRIVGRVERFAWPAGNGANRSPNVQRRVPSETMLRNDEDTEPVPGLPKVNLADAAWAPRGRQAPQESPPQP